MADLFGNNEDDEDEDAENGEEGGDEGEGNDGSLDGLDISKEFGELIARLGSSSFITGQTLELKKHTLVKLAEALHKKGLGSDFALFLLLGALQQEVEVLEAVSKGLRCCAWLYSAIGILGQPGNLDAVNQKLKDAGVKFDSTDKAAIDKFLKFVKGGQVKPEENAPKQSAPPPEKKSDFTIDLGDIDLSALESLAKPKQTENEAKPNDTAGSDSSPKPDEKKDKPSGDVSGSTV